jgi:hypothetical protein
MLRFIEKNLPLKELKHLIKKRKSNMKRAKTLDKKRKSNTKRAKTLDKKIKPMLNKNILNKKI